jgi:hypothetical protein
VALLAHTSTVSFAGTNIGNLRQFQASQGSASTADITGVDALVIGAGANSRIRRQVDALGVEPGTASVRLLGMPPFSPLRIGEKGSLVITTPGGSQAGEAILLSYDVEGSVGELLTGSASFQFTGA